MVKPSYGVGDWVTPIGDRPREGKVIEYHSITGQFLVFWPDNESMLWWEGKNLMPAIPRRRP